MKASRTRNRAMAVVAAAAVALGSAGCGDESAGPVSPAAVPAGAELDLRHGKGVVGKQRREGLPATPAGARVLSLPQFGTISWRCDTSSQPVRYATSLRVPSNAATLTGTVKTASSKRTRFTVQPGDRVSTPMTADRSVRWDVRFHHPPAPRRLRVKLGMDRVARTGGCELRVAESRRVQPRAVR